MTATATCQHNPSRDAADNPVTYEPGKAVDGVGQTAWRCAGDGTGHSLTVTYAQPVSLQSVALIPGLAKTDPADGTDRYAQNRRISRIRISFDTGGAVDVALDTSSSSRGLQGITLSSGVVTRSVTITILSSTVGSSQNQQPAMETVAISEIAFG